MRLAVLSDIHGNLVALEAVLADLQAAGGADLTWCLGDLAAFGGRPAECVRRIKALAEADEGKTFKVIGGNTDRYLVNGTRFPAPSAKDEDSFKRLASEWQTRDTVLNWNVGQLSFDDYEFLKKIRYQEVDTGIDGFGHVIGFHAVPGDDEKFLTAETPAAEVRDLLLDREGRLALCGHTHIQMDRADDLGGWRVINVGSVGLSVGRPGRAEYAILTFSGDHVDVDLRSLSYDLDAAVRDFEASGHPAVAWAAGRLRPSAAGGA